LCTALVLFYPPCVWQFRPRNYSQVVSAASKTTQCNACTSAVVTFSESYCTEIAMSALCRHITRYVILGSSFFRTRVCFTRLLAERKASFRQHAWPA